MLDTKNIADPALAELVGSHHERGKEKFQSFMEALENEEECTFYQLIKKNKASFFKHEQAASSSKEKVLKDDCHLFSRLFISCKTDSVTCKNSSSMRTSQHLHPSVTTAGFVCARSHS